jgi:hypothetical protein
MMCVQERMSARLLNRLVQPYPCKRYLRPIEELWRRQSLVLWPLGRHLNWHYLPLTQHARSSTQASAR